MSALTRRSVLAAGGLAALAACSSEDAPSSSPSASPSAAGTPSEAAAAFPVTIEHRFGSTEIPAQPQRVVALGGGDMEAAIALGVVPVGGADWFGFDEELRPWVASALDGADAPQLLQAFEPSFEKIAALAPDVILYVNTTNEEDVYNTLAKIAPTVAGPASVKNSYGVPWQDQVATIGTALGVPSDSVVADTEAAITAAAAAHPEFAGKTITAGVYSPDQMSVWMPSDPRMRLLSALGFSVNDQLAALDEGDFFVSLSQERLDLMEADVIFIAALGADGKVTPELVKDELFQNLAAVQGGHAAYFPGPGTILTTTPAGNFSSAFSIGGPLGIPACLDELTTMLSGAVTGTA